MSENTIGEKQFWMMLNEFGMESHAVVEYGQNRTSNVPLMRMAQEIFDLREWRDRLQRTTQTVTCVYCGKEYPPGSPTHNVPALTAHIKVCEKHPMRAAEADVRRLAFMLHPEREVTQDYETGLYGVGGRTGNLNDRYWEQIVKDEYQTPREAIDAAMKKLGL